MLNFGQISLGLYGALMFLGGIMGYVLGKPRSVPSLIAGTISALIIAFALNLSRTQPKLGLGIGATVAVVLVAVFIRRYMETHKVMPSLMLVLVSVVAALVVGISALRSGN